MTDHPPEHDPFEWFAEWLADAEAYERTNPNAMVLSTVDADGAPDSRAVLLKGFDQRGFVFYTNLDSTKGRQLAVNPLVALCFYWRGLDRQVRVRGVATPVDLAEADAYFASRPRGSQLGAWASEQSRPLASRGALLARVIELGAGFYNQPVPRPPFWSGFRVRPSRIEFWTGQPDRLHDRWMFERVDETWRATRLSP